MKCCESKMPITVPENRVANSRVREVAAQFAAELTRAAFAPLAKALGFYGDAAVAATAQTMALHESGGLTDTIARAIERAR